MKQHLISQTKEQDKQDRYSTYRNPDEKLRKEIASFKLDETKVTLGWPKEKEYTILEYEADEVKCQHGRSIVYFPLDEVKEAQADLFNVQLNQKYPAYKYFKKHFGIVSSQYKHEGYMTLKKLDLVGGYSLGQLVGIERELNPLTVETYETAYEFQITSYNDGYSGICLIASVGAEMMNLYFNKDGDYVNRNYNINLNEYKCKDINPKGVMKYFEERVLELGSKYEFYKGKYFNNKHCLIPFATVPTKENGARDLMVGVEIIPMREDKKAYQDHPGSQIYKKPKTVEKKTNEDLLKHVQELIPQEMHRIFAIETSKDIVEDEMATTIH